MALRTQPNLNKENGPLKVAEKRVVNVPKLTRPALGDVRNKITINKNTRLPVKKNAAAIPEPVEKQDVFHQSDVRVTRSKSAETKEKETANVEEIIPMECDSSELTRAFSSILLPPSVLNVDADDYDNPQMVHEYAKEIFDYLKCVESQFPIRCDFLNEQKDINSRMRGILVDWLVQVHQRFSLLQETLFLTVAILDRFLQVQQVSKSHLQLAGVTAMYVAGKYEEMYPAEVSDFVYITDNAYTKTEIFKMEMALLRGLTFDLNRPLPIHFLRRFSKVGCCDAITHQMAKYIMELSMPEYTLCYYPPSHLAAAALYLSLQLTEEGEDAEWNPTLVFYTGYAEAKLLDLVKELAALLSKASTAKLQSIRTKYSQSKFGKISLHASLSSSKLSLFLN